MMKSRVVLLSLSLVLLASGPVRAADPVYGQKHDGAEYVVVEARAELWAALTDDEPWRPERDVAVRLVDTSMDEYWLVETDPTINAEPWIASEVLHCQAPLRSHGLALRFWVSPGELRPVVAKEAVVEHDDKSSVTLLPGTVVEPVTDAEGVYRVGLGADLSVELPLPDDVVGRRYSPSTGRFHAPADPKRLAADATLWVGDEQVDVHSRAALPVVSHTDARVALESGCWSLVARLESDDGEDVVEPQAGNRVMAGSVGSIGAPDALVARVGSTVYRPTLEPSTYGRVVFSRPLTGERDKHGALRCFEVTIGGVGLSEPGAAPTRPVRHPVCFEPDDLETRSTGPSGGLSTIGLGGEGTKK